MRYSFAGHETFTCKNYWLKKGYDHSVENKKFNDEAVIDLGVGKNMVNSISFWLKAFGLYEDDVVLRDLIFHSEKGYDPYLEDIGTIWFLHHMLVTTNKASTYNLVFNYFRKLRIDFNVEQLVKYLETECEKENQSFSSNSIKKDCSVFINNYTKASKVISEKFSPKNKAICKGSLMKIVKNCLFKLKTEVIDSISQGLYPRDIIAAVSSNQLTEI